MTASTFPHGTLRRSRADTTARAPAADIGGADVARPRTAADGTSDADVVAARARIGMLLAACGEDLRATARHFTKNAADADDLLQDVSLRALAFADKFAPGTNFGAWMRTMMRNLAINRTRYEARRPRPASVLAGDRASSPLDTLPAPSPAEGAAGAEGAEEHASHRPAGPTALGAVRDSLSAPLAAALDELAPRYRDVLLLWALGDHDYRSIAAIVGCPVGTVMSRLHRARRLVRERIAEDLDPRGVLVR